jgi:hypothetical protein
LEKLKEALWSPTSQGSKICIYKNIKVRNGRRKISESSSATSNLFVEACCSLNDDKQKRNSNQEMAYQQTLHEARWSSSHGLFIPGNAAAVATHTYVVDWSACAIGHSVVELFRVLPFPNLRVFVLVLPKDFSTPPQRHLVFLFGVGEFCLCV